MLQAVCNVLSTTPKDRTCSTRTKASRTWIGITLKKKMIIILIADPLFAKEWMLRSAYRQRWICFRNPLASPVRNRKDSILGSILSWDRWMRQPFRLTLSLKLYSYLWISKFCYKRPLKNDTMYFRVHRIFSLVFLIMTSISLTTIIVLVRSTKLFVSSMTTKSPLPTRASIMSCTRSQLYQNIWRSTDYFPISKVYSVRSFVAKFCTIIRHCM